MGRRSRFRVMRRAGGAWRPRVTSFLNSAGLTGIAAATTTLYSLAIAQDSPDKSLITDFGGTNIINVENNSNIQPRSFLKLILTSESNVNPVTVQIYRLKVGMTEPTSANIFNQGPQTEDNQQIRERTLFYRKMILGEANVATYLYIPLYKKRNSFLGDSERLKMMIANEGGVLAWTGFGRLYTKT